MQVPGSDNAGPGSDILWQELMLEVKETLLEKKKANGTVLGSNFILSIIFVSECTLSLRLFTHVNVEVLTVIWFQNLYLECCQSFFLRIDY